MKKSIYLFIALLLPGCIFLFLKFFAKNEFDVAPLFVQRIDSLDNGCFKHTYPYAVPDSAMNQYPMGQDSLLLLYFGDSNTESTKQMHRIIKSFKTFPVKLDTASERVSAKAYRRKCIFLMNKSNDLALLDRRRVIRGHYQSSDREDVDRLITEVTILLKKY